MLIDLPLFEKKYLTFGLDSDTLSLVPEMGLFICHPFGSQEFGQWQIPTDTEFGGAQPSIMPKTTIFNHISRSALSFAIIVSVLALSAAPMTQAEAPDPADLLQLQSQLVVDGLTQVERAAKIDAFYGQWNLPLKGQGLAMVQAADAYGLDWRLVASIGFIESTGGKFMIKGTYNAFGWGGGRIAFKSYDESISRITKHLAGLDDATDHYYAGKTLDQIIDTYNPPSVRHDYKKLIKGTMDKITAIQIPATVAVAPVSANAS